jgi:hypothetical protein
MALLKRGSCAPGRTRIEFEIPALGGSLIASSLQSLGAQLDLLDLARVNRGEGLPKLFSASVLDADGEPFWTEAEWSVWISGHMTDAMAVEVAVLRAWGVGREATDAAKKN